MWGDGRCIFTYGFHATPSRLELESGTTCLGEAGRWAMHGNILTFEVFSFDSGGRRFEIMEGYLTGLGLVINTCRFTDSPKPKQHVIRHDVYEEISVGALTRIHDW